MSKSRSLCHPQTPTIPLQRKQRTDTSQPITALFPTVPSLESCLSFRQHQYGVNPKGLGPPPTPDPKALAGQWLLTIHPHSRNEPESSPMVMSAGGQGGCELFYGGTLGAMEGLAICQRQSVKRKAWGRSAKPPQGGAWSSTADQTYQLLTHRCQEPTPGLVLRDNRSSPTSLCLRVAMSPGYQLHLGPRRRTSF